MDNVRPKISSIVTKEISIPVRTEIMESVFCFFYSVKVRNKTKTSVNRELGIIKRESRKFAQLDIIT